MIFADPQSSRTSPQSEDVWKMDVSKCANCAFKPQVPSAAVRSTAVVLLLLIFCFMYLPLVVGVLCRSLFWYALLSVVSSFAIILTRK